MNSKVFLNTASAVLIGLGSVVITQSGCGQAAPTPENAVRNETPHVESMRDLLKKIAADGKDAKAMSDLGMSFPMALARNKEIVEPAKPLFDKLTSTSSPEERQKLAKEMLDKLSVAKS